MVSRWLVTTNSPWWLRNSQRKLVRCRTRNHHQKIFQRLRVDSEVLAAPVDLEKLNDNWVGGHWKIINETSSKGYKWILHRAQPLLTEKQLMKSKPLPSLKSWTKPIPKVTRGFESACSPCWLRKSQQKLSRWRLGNHQQNKFQSWQLDFSARRACVDLETVTENWATVVFEIMNETYSKGDAWIRKCS
jgi:hypothetical protein